MTFEIVTGFDFDKGEILTRPSTPEETARLTALIEAGQ